MKLNIYACMLTIVAAVAPTCIHAATKTRYTSINTTLNEETSYTFFGIGTDGTSYYLTKGSKEEWAFAFGSDKTLAVNGGLVALNSQTFLKTLQNMYCIKFLDPIIGTIGKATIKEAKHPSASIEEAEHPFEHFTPLSSVVLTADGTFIKKDNEVYTILPKLKQLLYLYSEVKDAVEKEHARTEAEGRSRKRARNS